MRNVQVIKNAQAVNGWTAGQPASSWPANGRNGTQFAPAGMVPLDPRRDPRARSAIAAPARPIVPQETTGAPCAAVAESPVEGAIALAIEQMHADAQCEEGISGLATQVFYSKFHFSREFRRLTGTTPRRFLAAVRMHQAKTHLLHDDAGIAQVSNVVGYSSVGTFSTRFTCLVGAPPREWRLRGGRLEPISERIGRGSGRIQGRLMVRDGEDVQLAPFVGIYPDRVLQGEPVVCTRARDDGLFQLRGVPNGRWVVICQTEGYRFDTAEPDVPIKQQYVGYGFIEISGMPEPRALQIDLRPRSLLDPPIVFERTQGRVDAR